MDFPVAEPIRRALSCSLERHDLGYAASPDDVGFGEVVAGWASRRYGWDVDPSRVFMVPDVVRAIDVALQVVTGPGDGVVIQPPVYPPFFSVIHDAGLSLIENPLQPMNGHYEIDLDGLDAALRAGRALLLCNPQNPTGRCFTRPELEAVLDLAERHDVTVISDEIHSSLTYPQHRHQVFAAMSPRAAARTITVTAASKAWNFGGLKCGFAVAGSAALAGRMSALPGSALRGAGILGIEATVAALTEGDEWLDRAMQYLDGNRRLLARLLEQQLPAIRYRIPESTYLAWLDCRKLGLAHDPFTFFLDRARVALSDGRSFGSQGEGFVRLNFATSRTILREMVGRMARAVGRSGSGLDPGLSQGSQQLLEQ